jgi:hypothetical protein
VTVLSKERVCAAGIEAVFGSMFDRTCVSDIQSNTSLCGGAIIYTPHR